MPYFDANQIIPDPTGIEGSRFEDFPGLWNPTLDLSSVRVCHKYPKLGVFAIEAKTVSTETIGSSGSVLKHGAINPADFEVYLREVIVVKAYDDPEDTEYHRVENIYDPRTGDNSGSGYTIVSGPESHTYSDRFTNELLDTIAQEILDGYDIDGLDWNQSVKGHYTPDGDLEYDDPPVYFGFWKSENLVQVIDGVVRSVYRSKSVYRLRVDDLFQVVPELGAAPFEDTSELIFKWRETQRQFFNFALDDSSDDFPDGSSDPIEQVITEKDPDEDGVVFFSDAHNLDTPPINLDDLEGGGEGDDFIFGLYRQPEGPIGKPYVRLEENDDPIEEEDGNFVRYLRARKAGFESFVVTGSPKIYKKVSASGSFSGCSDNDEVPKSYSGFVRWKGDSDPVDFRVFETDNYEWTFSDDVPAVLVPGTYFSKDFHWQESNIINEEQDIEPTKLQLVSQTSTTRVYERKVICRGREITDRLTFTLSEEFTTSELTDLVNDALEDRDSSFSSSQWLLTHYTNNLLAINFLSPDQTLFERKRTNYGVSVINPGIDFIPQVDLDIDVSWVQVTKFPSGSPDEDTVSKTVTVGTEDDIESKVTPLEPLNPDTPCRIYMKDFHTDDNPQFVQQIYLEPHDSEP